MLRVVFVLASLSALIGCASKSSDDDSKAAKTAAQAQAAPRQKTVFDPQLQALQKAKDVQKAIDAGDARNRKAADDAEKDKDGDDGGGG
jgi:hypothetical protein